ncbi:PQQ-dependent sugar dehydrogenase [Verrucomicrobiota bacterium sgz303538]
MSFTPRVLVVFASALLLGSVWSRAADSAAPDAAQLQRGEKLFVERCAMCHQVTGQGVPPAYPPLAGSEWVSGSRKRLAKVLCEGLSGEITVKGTKYSNVMPAQVLDDVQVADVLSYIGNAWGNKIAAFTPNEVAEARADSRFKTFQELVMATAYQPLPAAPEGWALREVAQLPEFCTRFASNGKGPGVYVLAQNGSVYFLDPAAGTLLPVIKDTDYLNASRGGLVALGMAEDSEGRLWIVTNQRIKPPGKLVTNEVVFYRTSASEGGHPSKPEMWFRVEYPYGVGPYNHGVNHMAFGPDGMLYVNSGARTDGGESGQSDEFYKGGEVDITACIWRLDPKSTNPRIEVFARGIRNAYGFAWDGKGQLFTVSNGPDADAPEEMDVIEAGAHYGFPFQFSNWPIEKRPYPHTPAPPDGSKFRWPVANVGPAAGGRSDQPLYTFDPHSSPAGVMWCGNDFPEPLKNRFLITRFGNLLSTPQDVGFDVLAAKMEQTADGSWQARVDTVLAPLGRPLDVIRSGSGRALILEYTRPTDFKNQLGWLPGRVLELAPK